MSDDALFRTWFRTHGSHGLVVLHRIDDTNPVQTAQIEGYGAELRDGMQRHQQFGFSTMPLPGSKGTALYQAGHRGSATVIAVEDPRYRPVNQQPGEVAIYMVDGAKKDGSGGTMRLLLKGALGWAAQLFGMAIAIGDSNTSTVTIIGNKSVTITSSSAVIITDGRGTPQPVKLADGSNSKILMAV